jgi:hypothetical protein
VKQYLNHHIVDYNIFAAYMAGMYNIKACEQLQSSHQLEKNTWRFFANTAQVVCIFT